MTTLERIGFMQGRLSAMVDGKIQAFPWNEWREEFPRANALGLARIEWTIDQDRLRENPLNTAAGQQDIIGLSRRHALKPASLTGDCFMQAPFWKVDGETQKSLVADLDLVLASCGTLGIEFVVIPLVDNGRIENDAQTEILLRVLLDRASSLSKHGVKHRFRIRSAACPARKVHRQIPPRDVRHQLRQRQQRRARAMIPPKRFRPMRRAFSMCM